MIKHTDTPWTNAPQSIGHTRERTQGLDDPLHETMWP